MSLHSFSWIIPNELAGMGRPDGLPTDFEELHDMGIEAVVNLMVEGWSESMQEKWGLDYLHLPVPGFRRPKLVQVLQFVRFCDANILKGRGVVAHCLAGKGRTGTMLAAYLVHRGMRAEEAIAEVRRLRPGSLETVSQEAAVHEYSWHRR